MARGDDGGGGDAVLLHEDVAGGGGAEAIDADGLAEVADPGAPAEGGAGFDGDAGAHGRRQDLVAIVLRLRREGLPAWHRYDARLEMLAGQLVLRGQRDLHLGAGRDDDDLRIDAGSRAIGLAQDVRAA